MKKALLLTTAIVLCTIGMTVSAQKVKKVSGRISMLASAKKINVIYDYSEMSVGKFDKEADYVAKKKLDYNKKEAGTGDKWEKAWLADREKRFQPQFEELFNKYANVKIGDNPEAKYTMIVLTTRTEPGFNVFVTRRNAEIDAEIYIVETATLDKKLCHIKITKSPGRTFGGNDYDTGVRIQESYAAAGKGLGKFFKKALK